MDVEEVIPTERLKVPLTLTDTAKKLTYNVTDILSDGIFGSIYTGTQTNNNKAVLIKLLSPNGYQVVLECIKLLQDTNRCNETLLYIQDNGIMNETKYSFIVMSGEWYNFGELVIKKQQFILCEYFLREALSAIEFLHDRGFYHNNLCPSSFWYKNGSQENGVTTGDLVRLGDYEFCCKAPNVEGKEINSDNPEVVKIYEKRFSKKPVNLSYCGLNLHKDSKNYMKYDVESIFYIYTEYCEGKLPWNDSPNDEVTIIQGKNDMRNPKSKYYKAVPMYLREIISYIDDMKSDWIPNYAKIKQIMRAHVKYENYCDQPKLTEKLLEDLDKTPEEKKIFIRKENQETTKEGHKVKKPTKKHGVSKEKHARKEEKGLFNSLFKNKPKTKRKT
uniref:Protein kinase domain-containing protein n=1 Tax=Parastrongyloides trichosuri TaxID=131310 RepID=A0A0N4Z9Q7_PARTI